MVVFSQPFHNLWGLEQLKPLAPTLLLNGNKILRKKNLVIKNPYQKNLKQNWINFQHKQLHVNPPPPKIDYTCHKKLGFKFFYFNQLISPWWCQVVSQYGYTVLFETGSLHWFKKTFSFPYFIFNTDFSLKWSIYWPVHLLQLSPIIMYKTR